MRKVKGEKILYILIIFFSYGPYIAKLNIWEISAAFGKLGSFLKLGKMEKWNH